VILGGGFAASSPSDNEDGKGSKEDDSADHVWSKIGSGGLFFGRLAGAGVDRIRR
jgi:hypothetical protein